jgi:hypothetical protein
MSVYAWREKWRVHKNHMHDLHDSCIVHPMCFQIEPRRAYDVEYDHAMRNNWKLVAKKLGMLIFYSAEIVALSGAI